MIPRRITLWCGSAPLPRRPPSIARVSLLPSPCSHLLPPPSAVRAQSQLSYARTRHPGTLLQPSTSFSFPSPIPTLRRSLHFHANPRPQLHHPPNRTQQRHRNPFAATLLHFHIFRRSFHPSKRRNDIFFITVPAVKAVLLNVTRVALVFIPLLYRWNFFRRYPLASRPLIALPIVAVCLVLAMGLSQSQRTSRWRLLLMSEREEMEWSNQRFDDILADDSILILPPEDPRVQIIQSVCSRLIQALQDDSPVSAALFPREEVIERIREREKRKAIIPSARTDAVLMPFLPESSNPEKILGNVTWDIFVIDKPKINAFVLPNCSCFCYTGLLEVCEEDPNMLAAVVAHEISHVTERHSTEALGFLALSGVVFDVLRGISWSLTVSFPFVGDGLAVLFNFLDRTLGQRAFGRKLELEADALGLELMARAGFDPRASLKLWKILNEIDRDVTNTGEHGSITDHIALLRTHPTGKVRLETLESILPNAIKIFEETQQGKSQPIPLSPESLANLRKT